MRGSTDCGSTGAGGGGGDTEPGKDRDEFPPAVIRSDDPGKKSVKLIDPSDNRSSGAALGNALRELPDGTREVITPPEETGFYSMNALDRIKESGRSLSGVAGSFGSASWAVPRFLSPLYVSADGFTAFSEALLVPPYSVSKTLHDEGALASFVEVGEFCFSYDLFGAPFVFAGDGRIERVDPETRERSLFSPNLEEWANRVSAKPNFELGASLASEWHLQNRRLLDFERLVPKQPFVIGGDYVVENLVACESRA